jgi:hypothetical protein
MQQGRGFVTRLGFEGVGEGVAEVEQGAAAGRLVLVRATMAALISTARTTAWVRASGSCARIAGRSLSSQAKKSASSIAAALTTSAKPARSSRGRAGWRARRCRPDQAGLVEGADQVLAARRVDGGLAAHGAVHLGQQGGRDLDKGRAALVDRGREPARSPDDAAAEGRDRVAAIQPQRQQASSTRSSSAKLLLPSPGGRRRTPSIPSAGRPARSRGRAARRPRRPPRWAGAGGSAAGRGARPLRPAGRGPTSTR